MKKFFLLLIIFSITNFSVLTAGAADKVSVKTMPPVVIKTLPQSGDTSVDPSVQEIRVTFSKEMMINKTVIKRINLGINFLLIPFDII
jgi:hypothetical protein